ncbi:MAG: hypothetical protein AB8G11_01290 [Saprospiraceae bacterium]
MKKYFYGLLLLLLLFGGGNVGGQTILNESESQIFDIFQQKFKNNESLNNVNGIVSIPDNPNRIQGNSWYCHGVITILNNGTVSGMITTRSHRYTGFTGAVHITLYDAFKKPVYTITTPSYGVNGKSKRYNNWAATIDRNILNISKYASAHGVRHSTNRTIKMLTKYGEQALKKYLMGNVNNKHYFHNISYSSNNDYDKLLNVYAPPLNKWGTSYTAYSTFGENPGCKISIQENYTNGNIRLQVQYNTRHQSLEWREYVPGTWINAQVVKVRATSTLTGGTVTLKIEGQ